MKAPQKYNVSLGFTLVEIMIVIAMIGILAAALFPNMTEYLKRARDTARVSDLHNIATGIAMYEIDKETLPPHVSGCYPTQKLLSGGYIKVSFISPKGAGYDEGCGISGKYAYGVSTGNVLDPQSSLLMAMMENWNGGNYTGSTLGMTGDLTLLGHFNATFSLSRGTGSIYILRPSAGSGGTAGSPPPAGVNGSCSGVPGLCSLGTVDSDNPGVCGGSRTWICKGQFGGSNTSCISANGACGPVTATFDADGGIGHSPASKVVAYNTMIGTLPSNPTLAGHSFSGWYTATTGGVQITPSTVMTSNATYYAQWNCSADGYPNASCSAVGQTYTAISKYSGCDTPDKEICVCKRKAQTWPMCNVGSTVAGLTSASYGSMFQWGRNAPFSSTGTVPTAFGPLSLTQANDATGSFILAGSDWLSPQDDTLWFGSPNAMQGPCATGYHVPTFTEWCDIADGVGGTSGCPLGSSYSFANVIQIPAAGYRIHTNSSIQSQGTMTILWTSSIYSNNASRINIGGGIITNGIGVRAYGFSVRCVKN